MLQHGIKNQFFIPFYCRIIFHCMDMPYFNYSLVVGHLGCFHFFKKLVNFYLAALGLCCRTWLSLVAVSGGYSSLRCVGFLLR